MTTKNKKTENDLLEQCRNSDDREKVPHIIEKAGDIHLKGLNDYYKLREKWSVFLCRTSIYTLIFIGVILLLKGFCLINISDYLMGGLIAVGALDNALNRHVTRFLFPNKG